MKVEFKYNLGEKVRTPFETEGRVSANSHTKSCSDLRVLVEYADKNGAIFSRWFDEKELDSVKSKIE